MPKRQQAPAPPRLPELTMVEWQARATELCRDPADLLSFALTCVACGFVYTVRQVAELGMDPDRATFCCYGRLAVDVGRLRREQVGEWGRKAPCNWTIGGLFGDLGRGQPVRVEDRVIYSMPFADKDTPLGAIPGA